MFQSRTKVAKIRKEFLITVFNTIMCSNFWSKKFCIWVSNIRITTEVTDLMFDCDIYSQFVALYTWKLKIDTCTESSSSPCWINILFFAVVSEIGFVFFYWVANQVEQNAFYLHKFLYSASENQTKIKLNFIGKAHIIHSRYEFRFEWRII